MCILWYMQPCRLPARSFQYLIALIAPQEESFLKFAGNRIETDFFFKSSKVCGKKSWMHCTCTTVLIGNLLQTPRESITWCRRPVRRLIARKGSGAPRAHVHLVNEAKKKKKKNSELMSNGALKKNELGRKQWCTKKIVQDGFSLHMLVRPCNKMWSCHGLEKIQLGDRHIPLKENCTPKS